MIYVFGKDWEFLVDSHFMISSPDCTLYMAITHMTKVFGMVEHHVNLIGIVLCETLLFCAMCNQD